MGCSRKDGLVRRYSMCIRGWLFSLDAEWLFLDSRFQDCTFFRKRAHEIIIDEWLFTQIGQDFITALFKKERTFPCLWASSLLRFCCLQLSLCRSLYSDVMELQTIKVCLKIMTFLFLNQPDCVLLSFLFILSVWTARISLKGDYLQRAFFIFKESK